MIPRELVESPKSARESVASPSPVEHEDMHEVSVNFQDHHDISLIDTTLENSDGSLDGIDDVCNALFNYLIILLEDIVYYYILYDF